MQNTKIVGILNTTPDSYYDGGKFTGKDAAIARVQQMLDEGADSIDIGGESTGPGSQDVSVDEELCRVVPVLDALGDAFDSISISIDTYKAPVAREVLMRGVGMINDVTAGRGDSDMLSFIAETSCWYVMMYAKDSTARTTTEEREYDDIISEVYTFLEQRITLAEEKGIERDRIILDPGLGFFLSSNPAYSFEVIARLSQLSSLGCPLYVSPSRKSFLSGEEKLPPQDRLSGTLAATAFAVQNGATYIRTHDVAETRRAVEISNRIIEVQPDT